MKTITLICAILWAVTSVFHLYGVTMGDYAVVDLFSVSPIDALETVVWFFTDIAMTIFFFVLWSKQS